MRKESLGGRAVLGRIDLVRINDRVLNAAGTLLPPALLSLDGIHLGQQLGPDLSQIVSHDDKMLQAAKLLGLKTASPV